MNCDDFRQRLIARPDELTDDMGEHMSSCGSCREMATQVQATDEVLRRALYVEVPDNLGQTVLMQKILKRRRRGIVPLFALAATVLVGIGMTAGLWLGRDAGELAGQLIAHIEHEPYLLQPSVEIVPIERVSSVLRDAQVELGADIGRVRHIGMCEFRGHQVPHLVVHTDSGPVTVMLLPYESIGRDESFDTAGFFGVITPRDGGSIAVIGNDSSVIEPVRSRFDRAVSFSI